MILGLIIIYAFCAYGLSNIIIYSSGPFNIFTKFRENSNKYLPSNLGELFECMICFPTWVGLIMSTINIIFCPNISFTPFMLIFQNIEYWYLIIPFDGFFTSGIVWLIHTFQEMMERVNNNE
jgi:hypothetical protein